MAVLKPAKSRPPLRSEVYEGIREAILRGTLAPGTHLVEARLAAQLRTSRTPVREALHKLDQEGLVSPRGPRGMVVVGVDPDDVREIMTIRELLEPYTARLAATRVTDGEVRGMEVSLRRSERAIKDGNVEELLKWNTRFHDAILEASRSQRLRKLLTQLRDAIQGYRLLTLQLPEFPLRSHHEHRAILDALRRRDAEAAESLLREHLQGQRPRVWTPERT